MLTDIGMNDKGELEGIIDKAEWKVDDIVKSDDTIKVKYTLTEQVPYLMCDMIISDNNEEKDET